MATDLREVVDHTLLLRAQEVQARKESIASWAVFYAAAARHPDWRPAPDNPGEWHGPLRDKDHPQNNPERLIAWFERTYPAEAARITAEALGN